MHKVELAQQIFLVQASISLHRGYSIHTDFHDRDAVEYSLVAIAMGFQCFYD
jgi:hypothetical protein